VGNLVKHDSPPFRAGTVVEDALVDVAEAGGHLVDVAELGPGLTGGVGWR
jgi:hypothetical protein